MHLIGLVEHPDHVCCRYRLSPLEPFFAASGHLLQIRSIPRGLWARLQTWRSLRAADAVILQRRLMACWHVRMIRRNARRLIYDFDDAVYQRDSYAGNSVESRARRRRFIAVIHSADLIIAGNSYLKQEAARFAEPDRIQVIPTCVDPSIYPTAKHAEKERTQLVWIGSGSTVQGFERRRPLFDTVAKYVPNIELKVICDRFPTFETMRIVPVSWSPATEHLELAGADIGVSWVPDDLWSRGKCGLKVLQYMAAGLPVVANPVGVQAEMVRHGETGFLAETQDDWTEAIRQLAGDPALRQRMGRAARRVVERDYSVTHAAELWLQLLSPASKKAAA
jgi:glycosyltransferase involved in cell wall biosynthesis